MTDRTNLTAAANPTRLEEIEAAFLRADTSLLGSGPQNVVTSLADRRPTAIDWPEVGEHQMTRTVRTRSSRCC